MDPRTLREVFGSFATGVTVVTCFRGDDRTPHGATVTAFTPISLDPPLCQVSLTRTSRASEYLDDSPFAINVLREDQLEVAMHFAGKPQAIEPTLVEGERVPFLAQSAATIVCEPYAVSDGGDHLLFLGRIVSAEVHDRKPLLFHRSDFRVIGDSVGVPA